MTTGSRSTEGRWPTVRRALLGLPLLALGLAGDGLSAQTLYRWTDEDGVTHFSDRAPLGVDVEVGTIEWTPMTDPEASHADSYWSVTNQAKRMEESRRRLAYERFAQEMLRAQRQSRDYPDAAADAGEDEPYYGFYPYSSYGYPYPPGYQDRLGAGGGSALDTRGSAVDSHVLSRGRGASPFDVRYPPPPHHKARRSGGVLHSPVEPPQRPRPPRRPGPVPSPGHPGPALFSGGR